VALVEGVHEGALMNRPPSPNYGSSCEQYLRLSDAFTIDQAAALWCSGDPGEDIAVLRAAAPCFTIKHDLIFQAVAHGKLPASLDGDGVAVDYKNLFESKRQRLRIMRTDLVAWFESLPTGDRPAFLFDGGADAELPDVSEVAEMTANRAIAIMAWLLTTNRPAMQIGERPNAKAIGEAVADLARRQFGEDVRGFASFHKRVSNAMKTLETDSAAGLQTLRRRD
jgi:hypothetical protein